MINRNTLTFLSKYAFGSDIDTLESALIDLKQASKVSTVNLNTKLYSKLYSILKEIKPNSTLFTNETSLISAYSNEYDQLIIKYQNYIHNKVYRPNSPSLEFFKSNLDIINSSESACIMAIPNLVGIDISILYINGYITSINIIGKDEKYNDITDKLKSRIPSRIDELANYGCVGIRGKLCIKMNNDNICKSFNTYCSIMRNVRLGINFNDLDIIVNDIFSDKDIPNCISQWDKLEYLEKIGFQTVPHYMARDVIRDTLDIAIDSIEEEISSNKSSIEYSIDGIIFKINNDKDCIDDNSKFIYYTDCDPNEVFSTVVKGYKTKNNHNGVYIELEVREVKCSKYKSVDSIRIYDIYSIDKYKLYESNKVKFIILNDEPIIYGEML